MKYRIVCTTRKENDSIDKLGFIEKDVSSSGYRYLEDKENINRRIKNGDNFFFTNEDGKETEVIAVENDHVRTNPDGTKKNNLLHLNKCALK